MGTSIGGVTVARGGTVYWGALLGVLVGGPVYAFFKGWIRSIHGLWGWLTGGVVGVGEFLAAFIGGFLDSSAWAIQTSWWSFLADVQAFAGPLTFLVTAATVSTVFYTVYWGITRWLG